MWYNRENLHWQWQYAGTGLQNLYIAVCDTCLDVPQAQLRALALPADPVPIQYPRTEDFLYDATQGTTQPYGQPIGLETYAVMPLGINPTTGQVQAYGTELPMLSLVSNGTTTVTATCSAAHGLSTDDQVAVAGISDALAAGFFSVTVTSATSFTYQTYSAVPAASLLAAYSRVITVLVGLPRGETTIVQIAP